VVAATRASADDPDGDREEAVGVCGGETGDRHPSAWLQNPAHLCQRAETIRDVHQPEAREGDIECGIIQDQMLAVHGTRLKLSWAEAPLTRTLGREAKEVGREIGCQHIAGGPDSSGRAERRLPRPDPRPDES
jgi:hypothetical protein